MCDRARRSPTRDNAIQELADEQFQAVLDVHEDVGEEELPVRLARLDEPRDARSPLTGAP